MNILICRWDIFVYPDILDTMKNEGHLCDVLDFSAIKMSDEDIASFTTGELYNHKYAEGFINLFGLSSKVRAMKLGSFVELNDK